MAPIYGPNGIHGVPTPRAYEERQAAAVAALQERFRDGRHVHSAPAPAEAYVNDSRWVLDCNECRSGAAVDVEAGVSRCFECGAVYSVDDDTLVLPSADTIASIVAVLGARPDRRTRNWQPGETLSGLRKENRHHGLPTKGRK